MPWVRLHGVKDYYDMAHLSERFPDWRQTVNLVPSLLEQIRGYIDGTITDRALLLSRKPAAELEPAERKEVVQRFFDAHPPHMIHPYPRYDELYRKRAGSVESTWEQFTDRDLLDLQVWHNLSWIDPMWLEDSNHPLRELIEKQRGFTEEEKRSVLDFQFEILGKIIPIHKKLFEEGKIELTTTPYYHPISPLLCDSSIAKVSNPRDPVPDPPFKHPEDAEWHLREGLRYFENTFGRRPRGMWPSEGSVSDQACALMAAEGLEYFATSQDILFRSEWSDRNHTPRHQDLYRLHRLGTPNGEIDCVFRDQELSDCIGFIYANWAPKDAAADFVNRIKLRVGEWTAPAPPLVNVILDGENCWEFYHRDGHDFLNYTIEAILRDPQIQPATVPEYREMHPAHSPTLNSIFPGSWIAHNFRIWIGHPEDNAAWHYLREARETLTRMESGLNAGKKAEAWKQIHICEGSDWYWWFGDENSSAHDSLFDEQFRNHLARMYEILGQPVPGELRRPIKRAKKDQYRGSVLLLPPKITGRRDGYYEWLGADKIRITSSAGTMHQGGGGEIHLRFGRCGNSLCFLIQLPEGTLDDAPGLELKAHFSKPSVKTLAMRPSDPNHQIRVQEDGIEGSLPLERLGIGLEQEAWLFFGLSMDGKDDINIPAGDELYLPAYTASNASPLWFM